MCFGKTTNWIPWLAGLALVNVYYPGIRTSYFDFSGAMRAYAVLSSFTPVRSLITGGSGATNEVIRSPLSDKQNNTNGIDKP